VKARTLILGGILLPIVAAQVSNTDALNDLRKTHPTVKWRSQPVAVVDVLCEGKPGTVILGSEKNDVVVGVVSGLREHKTEVLSFPIRSDTQNGFCAFPIRIETYPLNCEPDIGALPGCKPTKGCRSFAVIDDECDSFNFYWDSSRRALGWWRH
jgi:hypothetical protein